MNPLDGFEITPTHHFLDLSIYIWIITSDMIVVC